MRDDFKWRHYEGEIVLTAVRWTLRYALTHRIWLKSGRHVLILLLRNNNQEM